MVNPEHAIRFLLRKPGTLESRITRWTVLVLAGTGAGVLALAKPTRTVRRFAPASLGHIL
jgi:hypothetical protein